MFRFVQGSTFNQALRALLDGAPFDNSNCKLTAVITNTNDGSVIDHPACFQQDTLNGIWLLTAVNPTSTWPACKAKLAIGFTTPLNEIINFEPTYFRIIDTPLASA